MRAGRSAPVRRQPRRRAQHHRRDGTHRPPPLSAVGAHGLRPS